MKTNGRFGGAAAGALSPRTCGVFASSTAHAAEGEAEAALFDPWLARGANVSERGALKAVLSLIAKGALCQAECGRGGRVVAVRLPEEIRAVRAGRIATAVSVGQCGTGHLEKADFLQNAELREAAHLREGGQCFYCQRRLKARTQVPGPRSSAGATGRQFLPQPGLCSMECNTQKGRHKAEDFLRWLYREGRLAASELNGRLRALQVLAAGKLRPAFKKSGVPAAARNL